jgi:hypothetical protein
MHSFASTSLMLPNSFTFTICDKLKLVLCAITEENLWIAQAQEGLGLLAKLCSGAKSTLTLVAARAQVKQSL